MKNKNVMMGYLFIAPWIIYFLVLFYIPFSLFS
ncbi:sugar ABC transporter permease, partial [Yersinia pestis]